MLCEFLRQQAYYNQSNTGNVDINSQKVALIFVQDETEVFSIDINLNF